MKTMYAISLGLTAVGVACMWSAGASPATRSFELTAIGYLLLAAGLMLLVTCLGATIDLWLKSRWRRALCGVLGGRRRRPPRALDRH